LNHCDKFNHNTTNFFYSIDIFLYISKAIFIKAAMKAQEIN
jgi:hypothetical protein